MDQHLTGERGTERTARLRGEANSSVKWVCISGSIRGHQAESLSDFDGSAEKPATVRKCGGSFGSGYPMGRFPSDLSRRLSRLFPGARQATRRSSASFDRDAVRWVSLGARPPRWCLRSALGDGAGRLPAAVARLPHDDARVRPGAGGLSLPVGSPHPRYAAHRGLHARW